MKFSLAELAAQCAATWSGNPDAIITGVNTLDEATAEDLSFLASSRYIEAMKKSEAGVICIDPHTPQEAGKNYLVSENPSRLFQMIAEKVLSTNTPSGFIGIHPTAVIHPTAIVHPTATIGPYVVIDQGSTIGEHTHIFSHVSIGPQVQIGAYCILYSSSVVREKSILGNRVILQPGAVIGSCGFGYTLDAQGHYQKLEQLGIVILEDNVEIGANTTIDRSRFKATKIRKGSKIDNLCQIAHNVEVGEDNAIAAQTGIAGSAKTGRHVMLGGQVGIIGHVTLDDEVMVASQSGISKSLKKGQYRGSPGIPIHEYHRQEVLNRKLSKYVERLKKLEASLINSEKKI
jgi:UDP-3-O-[3-hydroxymyristoyl] glucosamine N-acyltransferase